MKKKSTQALSLFLAVLLLTLTVFPASAASATAATIRLSTTTGTVFVTNSSGRSLTRWDNMLLYNVYHVETRARSYAWISLDSTKLTKLDASSKVQVRKSGQKLELLLSSGHLCFNVTSPLENNETLSIRVTTMRMGIRGTSGWVKVVNRWTTEIYVL